MIFGMGTDVVEISRIGAAYRRYGLKFACRVLGSSELSIFKEFTDTRKVEYLAGRFAAKEAIAKAIGCGIGRLNMPSVEIVLVETGLAVRFNDETSQADRLTVTNQNRAADGAVSALSQGSSGESRCVQNRRQGIWHLSISHTRDIAFAVAVCEGKADACTLGQTQPVHIDETGGI